MHCVFGCCRVLSVSVISPVTRMYCNKTTEGIERDFYLKVANVSAFSTVSLTAKFEEDALDWCWGGFRLRSQLITNKKYMWAFPMCAKVDDFE